MDDDDDGALGVVDGEVGLGTFLDLGEWECGKRFMRIGTMDGRRGNCIMYETGCRV